MSKLRNKTAAVALSVMALLMGVVAFSTPASAIGKGGIAIDADPCANVDPLNDGGVLSTDSTKLIDPNNIVHFGNLVIGNKPMLGGTVEWRDDDGCKAAYVTGWIMSEHVYPDCARLQIRSYDGNEWLGSTFSTEYCPDANGFGWAVLEDVSGKISREVDAVYIQVQYRDNAGSWVTADAGWEYLYS